MKLKVPKEKLMAGIKAHAPVQSSLIAERAGKNRQISHFHGYSEGYEFNRLFIHNQTKR